MAVHRWANAVDQYQGQADTEARRYEAYPLVFD